MAKFVKSDRELVDVDSEVKKLERTSDKKKNSKKNDKGKSKKNSKKSTSKKKGFFYEVRKEVSKVKWPTRKDMVKYSVATIIFIIFFAIFFYLIELILALLKMGV